MVQCSTLESARWLADVGTTPVSFSRIYIKRIFASSNIICNSRFNYIQLKGSLSRVLSHGLYSPYSSHYVSIISHSLKGFRYHIWSTLEYELRSILIIEFGRLRHINLVRDISVWIWYYPFAISPYRAGLSTVGGLDCSYSCLGWSSTRFLAIFTPLNIRYEIKLMRIWIFWRSLLYGWK